MSKPYDSLTDTYKVISVKGHDLEELSEQLDRKITMLTNNNYGLSEEVQITFIGGVNVIETSGNYRISQAILVTKVKV